MKYEKISHEFWLYMNVDGRTYKLEGEFLEKMNTFKCNVSERKEDYWFEQFYSSDPEKDVLYIIEKHNKSNENIFRLGSIRHGNEIVRLLREEFGDDRARAIVEENDFYVFVTRNYEEVRNYFALVYEHETGDAPSEEDLDDFIEFNYYLIPCSQGYIVIESDY